MPDESQHTGKPTHVHSVLFLCTGNSARSILAEAIMNRDFSDRFAAFSAGSDPKGEVNPHALRLLLELGFDTSLLRSKSWSEFAGPDVPPLDFVFTVCDNAAAESCPIWPGHPMTAHWGIPDPAAATGTAAEIALAFTEAYRMLHKRISAFAALPIGSLNKMSLQHRLREIGHMDDATVQPPNSINRSRP